VTGQELREKRVALNMTQLELSKMLGISANTVARWERNEVMIPPYLPLALKSILKKPGPKSKNN
jgi:transcriptional regulator with XRE-family HTH domain